VLVRPARSFDRLRSYLMTAQPQREKSSFFDRPIFAVAIGMATLAFLLLILYFIDFVPGLSGLKVKVYSGVSGGGYFATVEKMAGAAAAQGGKIQNIGTNGAAENLQRLSTEKGHRAFALVQNGLTVPKGFELVARLSKSETVFFLGPNAAAVQNFSGLRGKRIGIGPKGSGSAEFAQTLFTAMHMDRMQVSLSYHTAAEQMRLLKSGGLDLAIVIFADNAEIIENAILQDKMQFATFNQADSFAKRIPYLRTSYIREGYYDPINNIPASNRKVLKLDTMLLCKAGTPRSRIIGLLTVLLEVQPDLIIFNNTIPNMTGVAYAPAAKDYFTNQGPEVFDRYAPRLMDFMPLGNIVQLLMVISVLFNVLNLGNRFSLWRIDANRVGIESSVQSLFGHAITADEIAAASVGSQKPDAIRSAEIDSLIERLTQLGERCRKKSLSLLVPMGKEQAYRYQEEIISRYLAALKIYRDKVERHTDF
jgi:TRAP-type uncharacterized transport system substrate-binding protein